MRRLSSLCISVPTALVAAACGASGDPAAPGGQGGTDVTVAGGTAGSSTNTSSPAGTGGASGSGGGSGGASGSGGGGNTGGSGGTAGDLGTGGTPMGSGGSGGQSGVDAGVGGHSGAIDAGAAGGDSGPPPIVQNGPFPLKPDYIIGADISYTLQDEAGGAKYADEQGVKPLEEILANNGFNYIRLRTFVDPKAQGGYSREGYCDTAHTITMARRVKSCGMGVFLDFHMSDTWSSIGEQHVPSSWANMNPTDMQKAAHDYVKGVLDQMVAAGVKPDMVQVGNEVQGAVSGISISNWANFSGLINAGIKAVRETDPSIIMWGQHGQPRPEKGFAAWSDKWLAGNPKIDVDGLCGSTYGTNNDGADWKESFGHVIDTYKKPVMSCEYTDEKRDLLNSVMHGFPNKLGRGSFLWEPTRYPGINQNTLFNKSGNTYTTNAAMPKYAALAKSYGLPVPSGTCKK